MTPPSPASADLIGNDLALGEKQGYKFTVTGNSGGYVINANPITYGSSGNKSLIFLFGTSNHKINIIPTIIFIITAQPKCVM